MKEYDETKYRLVPIGEIAVGDAVVCEDPSTEPDYLSHGEIYKVVSFHKSKKFNENEYMTVENDSGDLIEWCAVWAFGRPSEDDPNNWVEYEKSQERVA